MRCEAVVVLDWEVEMDVPAIVLACSDAEIQRWLSVPSPSTPDDGGAWPRRIEILVHPGNVAS
ncbi:MAG: hypothetical protein ACRDZ4_18900 [Egibacteraceae bacterium]